MLDALAATTPSGPPSAPPPGAADATAAADFLQLLGTTLPVAGRQAAAGGGTTLPAADDDAASDDDAPADDTAGAATAAAPPNDPMLLWLPVLPPAAPPPVLSAAGKVAPSPMTAPTAAAPLPATILAPPPALPGDATPPPPSAPATPQPAAVSLDPAQWQAVAPQRWTAPLPIITRTAAASPVATTATDAAAACPVPSPPTASPAPTATEPATRVAQPAAQVFAAAIALAEIDRPQRGLRRTIADQPLLTPLQTLAATPAVAATGDTQHAPFDLTRDADLARMVDHIETVRDQADAGDTRLRLTPDALGTIDVAVRRDGDRVQVHFTADRAETRTLLSDAQPRLQELADARGIRLAEANIAGGQGQSGSRTPDRQSNNAPLRNAAAPTDPDPNDPTRDERLA